MVVLALVCCIMRPASAVPARKLAQEEGSVAADAAKIASGSPVASSSEITLASLADAGWRLGNVVRRLTGLETVARYASGSFNAELGSGVDKSMWRFASEYVVNVQLLHFHAPIGLGL